MKFYTIQFYLYLFVLNALSLNFYAQNRVSLNSSDIAWKVKPQAEIGKDSLKIFIRSTKQNMTAVSGIEQNLRFPKTSLKKLSGLILKE